jgi:hypothetical protein
MLVTLLVPSTFGPAEAGQARERLQRFAGRLRSEVAAAIHRKRVPELVFQLSR